MILIHNFAKGARGVRLGWQCEEMGLAWRPELHTYPTSADYRAKYPPGSVPFVEDGEASLGESIAAMLYLADRYGPTPLLPSAPADRARVLQLTVASEAALPLNPLLTNRFAAPEEAKGDWTTRACEAQAASALAYADGLLGDRAFFVGEALTLADIAFATSLGLVSDPLVRAAPNLMAHRERMKARPAYQRALAAFTAA